MSNRTLRVNELIQRELSDILRKRHQSEAVAITLTEVRVAPDLRDARVFVSVVGTEAEATAKLRWLRSISRELRDELARRIVLKYMPHFEYVADHTVEQSARVLQMLEEIDRQSPPPPAEEPPPSA